MERLMTGQQVAELINVDYKTVMRWARERELPHLKLGEGSHAPIRFKPSKIKEWIESKEKEIVGG